ncbi:AsmA family protein [Roseomonas sp. USHLN139]|uniref:AsmA family protein n=1 Tax=Roseomonas sp. USHLN139 TaxID=3081298 RepID=UPI003B01D6B9
MSLTLIPPPRPRRRLPAVLVGGALLAAGLVGAALALPRLELGGLAAGRLQARLGRDVAIGSLRLEPGRWMTLRLEGLTVANLPGGSRPEMLRLDRASAELDLISVFAGPLRLRDVTLAGVELLLEHGPDDRANWHFGEGPRTAPHPEESRNSFPTLLGLQVERGDITLHTLEGKRIAIGLDQAALQAATEAEPARLTAGGRYQGVPLTLAAALGSFEALRDTRRDFPARLEFRSGETRLDFDGRFTDPVAVDGATGRLGLAAPDPQALLAMLQKPSPWSMPLRLEGSLTRQGRLWDLAEARGALGGSTLTEGRIRLREGAPRQPDQLTLELGFDRLDLNALLAGGDAPGGHADLPLLVDPAPGTLLELTLGARQLAYAGLRAAEARLRLSQTAGRLAVPELAIGWQGGSLRGEGAIEGRPATEGDGGAISGRLDATGLEVQVLGRTLGLGALPLQGRLDGHAAVTGQGATLNAAWHAAQASAVVTMRAGSIERAVIEAASTDLRGLLRRAPGMVPLRCLVAVIDLRGAEGQVAPLRLRTDQGTLYGQGRFDLSRRWMDFLVASEGSTTSSFALDVPIRLSGRFADPDIAPAQFSAGGRAMIASADEIAPLLAELQPFARRSACLNRPRGRSADRP